MLRKSAKTKVGLQPPAEIANAAKRKRVDDAVDMGQGETVTIDETAGAYMETI